MVSKVCSFVRIMSVIIIIKQSNIKQTKAVGYQASGLFYAMNKHYVTTTWIKELICDNQVVKFYNTETWILLREKKKAMEHNECERCRETGKHSPCEAVHHIKYLRQHPELALDINNLECLCKDCHYKEHHKAKFKKQLNEERW